MEQLQVEQILPIQSKIHFTTEQTLINWLKSITLTSSKYTLLPQQRENELNAILTACCIILKTDYNCNFNTITPEIFDKMITMMPVFIWYCCRYYMSKNNIGVNSIILSNMFQHIGTLNMYTYLDTICNVRSQNVTTPMDIANDINYVCFGANVTPVFIKSIVDRFATPQVSEEELFNKYFESVTELKPGMDVCGCDLIEELHKSEHTFVWKAKYKSHFVALKMHVVELPKNLQKSRTPKVIDAIKEHLRDTDEDYIGWLKLKAFSGKSEMMAIDYYEPMNLCVKRMTLFDGSIVTKPIGDKKDFIIKMGILFFNLHKLGYIYNNMSLNHIMQKDVNGKTEYYLIDYRNVNTFKSENVISRRPKHEFNSLAVIYNTSIYTFYDDLESLFYVFDYVLTKLNKVYNDINDEVSQKQNLSTFSAIISTAILSLRDIRNNDIYVNSISTPEILDTYITEKYTHIYEILNVILKSFNEIGEDPISLNVSQLAIYKKFREIIANDPRFSSMGNYINTLALMVTNYITLGTKYDETSMQNIMAIL